MTDEMERVFASGPAQEKQEEIDLGSLTFLPKLMFYTSLTWFIVGGSAGLLMVLLHATGAATVQAYYETLTTHGILMTFGGVFQLMMSLSLLRAGFCYGKPIRGLFFLSLYLLLNISLAMLLASTLAGVRVTYTLMFPLPAAGAFKGLWSIDMLTLFVWGVVLLLIVIVALYPASLAKILFFGKTKEQLVMERFVGTLSPSGMASMLPFIFVVPPIGAPILAAATLIGAALIGVIPLPSISWFLEAVNFNYLFWPWAHNLMEAMGIMAIGTVYWIVPRYTADVSREPRLYSEKLGIFAIIFYTTAAAFAFPHHLFTMSSTQPIGLSYVGQVASWLTGFGAAFSVFNILATGWRYGLRIRPASLAVLLGFALYITDGFLAMQLGTIGWNYRLHGTYYVTAHLMTILIAVTLIWIGAMYHHYHLLRGGNENEKLAYLHVILTAIAGFGLMYTMATMGVAGIPRRAYPFPIEAGSALSLLIIFGTLLAAAQAVFIVNLIRGGKAASGG